MTKQASEKPTETPSFLKRVLKRQLLPASRVTHSLRDSAVQINGSMTRLRDLFKSARIQSSPPNQALARLSDSQRFESLYVSRNWTAETLAQQKKGFKTARWLSLGLCWLSLCAFIAAGLLVENLYGLVFGCASLLLLTVSMAAKAFQCALYETQIQERSLFNASLFLSRKDLLRILFS